MEKLVNTCFILICFLTTTAQAEDTNFLPANDGRIAIYSVHSAATSTSPFDKTTRSTTLAIEMFKGVPVIRDFLLQDGSLSGQNQFDINDIERTQWHQYDFLLRVILKNNQGSYLYDLKSGSFSRMSPFSTYRGEYKNITQVAHVTAMEFIMNAVADSGATKFPHSLEKQDHLEQGWSLLHQRLENIPLSENGVHLWTPMSEARASSTGALKCEVLFN